MAILGVILEGHFGVIFAGQKVANLSIFRPAQNPGNFPEISGALRSEMAGPKSGVFPGFLRGHFGGSFSGV